MRLFIIPSFETASKACPLHAFCLNRQNDIELWRPGSAGEMPNAFYFLFLRAGGADGAIARRWSVAERRATPGNGEEENQALEGRQIMQIEEMLFSRPCRGFSCYCSSIPGLRAALRRFTPGYCSIGASGAQYKYINSLECGSKALIFIRKSCQSVQP